jgi:hypothetical protein
MLNNEISKVTLPMSYELAGHAQSGKSDDSPLRPCSLCSATPSRFNVDSTQTPGSIQQ